MLIHVFAVALGPYFAHYCDAREERCAAGFFCAASYVTIVMLLVSAAVMAGWLAAGLGWAGLGWRQRLNCGALVKTS